MSEQSENASLSADIAARDGDNARLKQENENLGKVSDENGFRDTLKDMAESGHSTIAILKYFYPDQIVFADSGAYHFYDISDEIKHNDYVAGNFSLSENGRIQYTGDDGKLVYGQGIDISKHNGTVDWEKVKASGVRFAFIRVGIRGYGSGKIVEDENFSDNADQAAKAGLKVGVYFFTQAVNEDEAKEEADFVIGCIKDKKITYPVVYDVEEIDNYDTEPRTLNLTQDQYTKNAVTFCEEIKNAGYEPMIYGNIKTFMKLLDLKQLENYDKWFADYITEDDVTPYFPYEFRIWQYRAKGTCDGVNGNCDENIDLK